MERGGKGRGGKGREGKGRKRARHLSRAPHGWLCGASREGDGGGGGGGGGIERFLM